MSTAPFACNDKLTGDRRICPMRGAYGVRLGCRGSFDNLRVRSMWVPRRGRHVRLLVVDDEPAILESTARLARACGFDVATCTNHLETAAVAGRFPVDVVLQDVRMPGIDLRCHLGVLRSDPRTARAAVVLFSAGMDVADVAAAV